MLDNQSLFLIKKTKKSMTKKRIIIFVCPIPKVNLNGKEIEVKKNIKEFWIKESLRIYFKSNIDTMNKKIDINSHNLETSSNEKKDNGKSISRAKGG